MGIEIIHQEYGHEGKSRWIVMAGDSELEEILPETAEAIQQLQAELEEKTETLNYIQSVIDDDLDELTCCVRITRILEQVNND